MEKPVHSGFSPLHRGRWTGVFIESVVVVATGLVFALLANALSVRGLSLRRDYFPGDTGVRAPANKVANSNSLAHSQSNQMDLLAEQRLKSKGLLPLTLDQALPLFQDPRYEQQLIVFLDARDEELYQKGHIPRAFLFNHYRSERYLADILPVCQTAERIVLYCHGGDCEDSEFAASHLTEAGIPAAKLGIYMGGFTEWSSNNLPVELGIRGSGTLLTPTQ